MAKKGTKKQGECEGRETTQEKINHGGYRPPNQKKVSTVNDTPSLAKNGISEGPRYHLLFPKRLMVNEVEDPAIVLLDDLERLFQFGLTFFLFHLSEGFL